MNLGSNRTQSSQSSSGSSAGQTFVDPLQQPFLQFLNSMSQNVAQGQLGAGGIGDMASMLSQQLGGQGQQFLQQFQGMQQAGGGGTDFLQQRVSQQNPFLNEQINQMGLDMNQQFTQSILPAISQGAQAVGGLGGGRQGVAQGLASQGMQQAFAQQSANLRFQDVGLRQAAAGQLSQGGLQAGQAGMGSLGGLFNMGMSPFAAQFQPLAQLAAILGGPTVLSQQQSQQQAVGGSRGSGFNFGLS
jgi:hypothetical protein